MQRDLMIGVVGTAILVTAMIGVFRYEAGQASAAAFDVSWTVETTEGPSLSGEETEGGPLTTWKVNLTQLNLTEVEFVLSWTDEAAQAPLQNQPDQFRLTVESPSGITFSAEADNGTIALTFPELSPLPGPLVVLAPTEDAARQKLTFASRAEVGIWNVTVELLDAGDIVSPLGGPAVQQDDANPWTLTTRVSSYGPVLAKR